MGIDGGDCVGIDSGAKMMVVVWVSMVVVIIMVIVWVSMVVLRWWW